MRYRPKGEREKDRQIERPTEKGRVRQSEIELDRDVEKRKINIHREMGLNMERMINVER